MDPENIAVMSVFMGLVVVSVVTTVTVALCCWCYHRKKRRRDLAAISRKGGLNIVLGDDLQRANQEGRLTVNVSLLDTARRVAIIIMIFIILLYLAMLGMAQTPIGYARKPILITMWSL